MRTQECKFLHLSASFLIVIFLLQSGSQSVLAGGSWLSKAKQQSSSVSRQEQSSSISRLEVPVAQDQGDIGTTVFDVVISLYNDPSGDNDPNNDTGNEDQTNYEQIVRFWADAVCEESNQAHKLGKVRIFRNGIQGSLADVVWSAKVGPQANVSGFGVSGKSILFGDVFPNACGEDCDINFLNNARHDDAGYTLGHEFGHYVLGLYDEYVGRGPDEKRKNFPQTGDTPVVPSIMNSQWDAADEPEGNSFEWLNHSTEDNFEAKTAQGRVYGKSGWDILIQTVADDPKNGDRSTQPPRVRYTALVGEEPTAVDNWVREGLPGSRAVCRNELEIIWMSDDIEMQVVVDRSLSMNGDPLANAQEAAKILVDEIEDGSTALGVVSFNQVAVQSQPVVPIPDPPGMVKEDIKSVIDGLSAGGDTALFDAADLANTNLQDFATTSGGDATQLVFLLSDGLDNSSSATEANVLTAYQTADVPLNTFAYGKFAPDGVLRRLAEETGGLFRASPTDLAEVASAFLAVKAALTSSAGIVQESASVPANGSTSFPFAVDSTLKELSIFVNYMGGSGNVDFEISSPGGSIVGVAFECTEVAGATSCGSVVDEANVIAEGTGSWSLNAINNTGSTIVVNANILATPRPIRTYDLVVASLGGNGVTFPEPILVTATITQDLPITEVSLSATITDPAGTVVPIRLVDTGENGDGIASDGTYSTILDYKMNGTHTIDVKVDNEELSARFTTDGFQPAHPASANENGETPEPLPPPPITENFTRTASVQFQVSGVVVDDHPDIAPGTPISPDNVDIPGRINFAGDPDIFTISTAGHEFLTLRVTGLALGMDPRLTVFEENGTTEIASATLDDVLADGGTYLALAVPVNGNAQIHAEVTHINVDDTGNYLFSAGEQIFSDPAVCDPTTPGAIIGTSGDDRLIGTPGNDVIISLAGNDSINGQGGDDCIDGGAGNDRINGGPGEDLLIGRVGNDQIAGGSGNDRILGGKGNDFINAGTGDDNVEGGPEDDTINGGSGTDTCLNGERVVGCE